MENHRKRNSIPPTLEYQSHRVDNVIGKPTRISIRATLVYAGFLTAILYLLLFNLSTDAPARLHGNPPLGLAEQRRLLNATDTLAASAANGKNVEYHVIASPTDWSLHGNFYTSAYFSAVYHQYPLRVLVGADDTVINEPDDLKNADHLPSVEWMHAHQVTSIMTILPGDQNGPQVLIHSLK